MMKTLKRGFTIEYGHRFLGGTEADWTGVNRSTVIQAGGEFKSLASLDLQVSAAGNKYK